MVGLAPSVVTMYVSCTRAATCVLYTAIRTFRQYTVATAQCLVTGRTIRDSKPGRGKISSVFQSVRTSSFTHPPGYWVGTVELFPRGKKVSGMRLTVYLCLVHKAKNEWSYTFSPSTPSWRVKRDLLLHTVHCWYGLLLSSSLQTVKFCALYIYIYRRNSSGLAV